MAALKRLDRSTTSQADEQSPKINSRKYQAVFKHGDTRPEISIAPNLSFVRCRRQDSPTLKTVDNRNAKELLLGSQEYHYGLR